MQQNFKILGDDKKILGGDKLIYPILSYTFDDPLPMFATDANVGLNKTTNMNEKKKGDKLAPDSPIDTPVSSGVSISEDLKAKRMSGENDWKAQTITVVSFIHPKLEPYKHFIALKTPLNSTLSKYLISSVKYALIGSYEMTVTAWGLPFDSNE